MNRIAPLLLLSLITLTKGGCYEKRPTIQPPGQAIDSYRSSLAGTCGDKRLDWLPAQDLNHFAKSYYADADVQSQQLIDKDTTLSCSASDTRPDCYNTGFIQAEVQLGGLPDISKHLCAMPVRCTGQSQCSPTQ